MYSNIKGLRVPVSTEEGEVADLSVLQGHGAAVNIKDNVLYLLNATGEITIHDLPERELLEFLGLKTNELTVINYQAIPNANATLIKGTAVGTVATSGDVVRLPYGRIAQVLFRPSSNSLVVNGVLKDTRDVTGSVSRLLKHDDTSFNPSVITGLLNGTVTIDSPISVSVTMFEGQSLSIGTLNAAYKDYTAPQVLDVERFKMFNGVGSIGKQDEVVTDEDIAELVGFVLGSEILGQSEYHSPALGFFTANQGSDINVLVQSSVGGTAIEDLSQGGATESYANSVKQLTRVSELHPDATVDNVVVIHGGANWQDDGDTYISKFNTFLNERLSTVSSLFPDSTPTALITQHGGELVSAETMLAQLKLHDDGVARCIGATYWLNRMYPNVSVADTVRVGNGSPERVHLNAKGYDLLGELLGHVATHDDYEPLRIVDCQWISDTVVELITNHPDKEVIADATADGIPLFPGNGIQLERGNGAVVEPVTVTGGIGKVTCDFGSELVYVGDRILIGFSPRDVAYYGDYVESNVHPTKVMSHLMGTNIRLADGIQSTLHSDVIYNWASVDRLYLVKNASTPDTQLYGSNIFRDETRDYNGFGSKWVFNDVDGTTTKTYDGEETTKSTTRSLGISTNKEIAAWAVRTGETYLIEFDYSDYNEGARFQFYVGGKGTTITTGSLVDGHFSAEVVAEEDFSYSLSARENSGFLLADIKGTLENISIRLKI